MPSRDLHRELSILMGIDPRVSRRVQALMDSTAATHGGAHRKDEIHSLHGATAALARSGELTAETARAAVAHLAQDRLGDLLVRANPIRGPARAGSKQLVEGLIVQALRSSRRRR